MTEVTYIKKIYNANNEYIVGANNDSQTTTMPTAWADNVWAITQYIGTTNQYYKNGHFYKCVSDGQDPATYSWEEIEVQDSPASDIQYSNSTSGLTATNVQDAIDEIDGNIDTINSTIEDIQDIVEVTTMEAASASNEWTIVQYKGATNANFTQWYFYKSVESSTPGTYEWVRIDVQPGTVINNINDIQDVTITTPSNGQVLKYNGTSNIWYNATDTAGDHCVYLTQAQYDQLSASEKADPNVQYMIIETKNI